ncbi:helix-turn-helix transcriptional regulator [Kitasatospora cineracea]|uniref:AAA ATPase-like protein n=1 Tax=Kitasatospora cineracea TaxID=88074 RepID=A0A8G1UJK4_9ACTN|nr:AAA family ATPase [Kitasatospora cineracea]ROR45236.1 AAA ATPase-like protein [Kitasatospora cineracea]
MAEEQNGPQEWEAGAEPVGQRLWERDQELRSVDQAVDRLCREFAAGGLKIGELLVFSGSPGIGKTSMLEQVRRIAGARQDSTVLFARGSERQRREPFRVLRQLLLPVLSDLTEVEVEEVFGSWHNIVAPAIGLAPPSDEVERIDPQSVRDGLDFVITQLAPRRAPLVVIVDDLHAVDQESLTWLASFAVRARELPVLLVFAYRHEFEEESRALAQQIHERAARKHELLPLNPVSVAAIVHGEFAEADDAFCRQVWAVTAGGPYDTVALLREVRDQNLEPVEENSPRLRDLAAAARGEGRDYWLDKLGTTVLQFAWAAALLGTEIKEDLAGRICGQGPAQSGESVQALRRMRVLTSQPNGRLEFVHPLIATSIYQSIPPGVRTGMHGIAATAIENSGGSLLSSSRHLLETHPGEGDDVIVRKLRRAAAENLAIGAPEAARRCLERALNEPPDEEDQAEVLYELACASLLTDPEATANQLRRAIDMDNGLSPDLRVEAVFRLSEVIAHSGDLSAAAALCLDESERAPEGPGRIRLLVAHLLYTALQRDEEDGPGRAERVRRLVAEVDPDSEVAHPVRALYAWDLTLRGGSAADALRAAEDALVDGRLPRGLGWTNTTWNFELPALLGLCFAYNDELARAEKLFSSAILEFEIAGWSGAHRGFAYFLMGYARLRRGFLPEAEDFLRRGLRIADRMGTGLPLTWNLVGALIDTLLARGRDHEAWEIAVKYRFLPPYHQTALLLPDVATIYGKLLISRGDYGMAVEVLAETGTRLDKRGWRSTVHAPWAGYLAVAMAHLDLPSARKNGEDAVARAMVSGSPSAIGTALRLAASVWEGVHAVELLQEAVGWLGRSPASYEHAHAMVDLGAALVQVGRSLEAAEHLYQGMELAKHCGADGLEVRARNVLASAGLQPSRPPVPPKDALNPQEWEVARLAVRPLPPQRIAEELGIPLGIVKQRLAAVHRKLGTGPEGLADALGMPTDGPGQAG